MSTLTPTGGRRGRRNAAVPVILVGVIVLAAGGAVGWALSRNPDPAPPASASGCPSPGASQATASVSPTGSASGSPKASLSPSKKPAALPKPAAITVDVFNATNRQGLAKSTAAELEKRGFQIGDVANDPATKPVTATAEVRYGPKGKNNAKVVAAQVPNPVLVNDKRADKTVSLALGAAFAGLATPEQAAATLAPTPSPTC